MSRNVVWFDYCFFFCDSLCSFFLSGAVPLYGVALLGSTPGICLATSTWFSSDIAIHPSGGRSGRGSGVQYHRVLSVFFGNQCRPQVHAFYSGKNKHKL